ncbi:hypothetical protein [Thalassotalea euphylliae]|uniref:DUF2818 family protein n=1 Tax=Thalassotalea euphylliae TaxID=1655234 RepID=A0A3E0UH72_9GAMM|nr:hypothetical protein [Thalassotalea euphylliae]REL36358.1 hypothetical protein DXX92_14130 [Thalassotalea euphylliae]
MNAELLILLLNLAIVVVAYGSIYPKLAGNNANKIALFDLLASGFALLVVGTKYWGTGFEFSVLFVELNWFWFTLVTYALVELPIAYWYIKKYKVNLSE